ncbi:MAG: carboxypeptidase regulatory-like domain-containing protein [Candidatus Saccharimonadales bacterium]
MKKHTALGGHGFTLTEVLIANIVFAIVALSFIGLFTALVSSASTTKRKAVALTLATNQMEYLKSLPYDSLAVAGGSIYSASPLPATSTQTVNNFSYTITTAVSYADDAYDGCASYPSQALKLKYCRNYPPPTGAPATDTNPEDYKVINVIVASKTGVKLAEVDTQVAARVSETSSTTGAIFVSVIDETGNPVSGASVTLTNSTVSPAINLGDQTDSNGVAIFYGMPPDTNGYDYVVSASKSGYSSLTTIAPSGSLQPNYSSLQVLTQQSSLVTLTIKGMSANSLVIETTDTSGNPIANMKTYIKGGYKKYSSSTDTSYYYDNFTPSDTRPTSDGSGLTSVSNLVPGSYIFCGDAGATNCKVGATTYFLVAAVPYSGTNAFNPIVVPTYYASNPPSTTFSYNSTAFLQKVRLMLTTDSNYPRISTLSPDDLSLASGGLSAFAFTITGTNLPCNSNPSSCSTSVRFIQGGNTYTASCTGTASPATQLNCTVNLTGISSGQAQLSLTVSGKSITIPAGSLIGGLNVTP